MMKSIWTSLVAIFFLCVSCGQENDFQSEIDNNVENITTKNTTTELPDPISQLVGMPINIMQPEGITSYKYLGCLSDRYVMNSVRLFNKDDNTGLQKWKLEKVQGSYNNRNAYCIRPLTDNSAALGAWTSSPNFYLALDNSIDNTNRWLFIEDKNDPNVFNILNHPEWYGTSDEVFMQYLIANNTTSYIASTLSISRGLTNNHHKKWVIKPTDIFTLINIEYLMQPEDLVEEMPDFVATTVINNNSSLEQTMTTTFGSKATETSNFSNTTGISVTTSGGMSVGIPGIFGGKFDTSTTNNKSWTYGKSESKEDSQSYSFPVRVPPYSSVTATASVQRYQMDVTYLATFKSNTSEKTLTLTGRWNGVRASTITYTITENKTNKVLKSFTNTPTSIVDLTK